MENFDIIYEFRLLAKKLQQDDRLVYLHQVRRKMDMDQELQAQIEKFSRLQYEYNIESAKEAADEAKIQNINAEIVSLYSEIMANEFMVEYNECKQDVDKLTTLIQAIIAAAVNGGDPMIVEVPESGCSGSCSSCSGCGI